MNRPPRIGPSRVAGSLVLIRTSRSERGYIARASPSPFLAPRLLFNYCYSSIFFRLILLDMMPAALTLSLAQITFHIRRVVRHYVVLMHISILGPTYLPFSSA
jgi:hypothetical protein